MNVAFSLFNIQVILGQQQFDYLKYKLKFR